MTAGWLRRWSASIAFATLLLYWNAELARSFAHAQSGAEAVPPSPPPSTGSAAPASTGSAPPAGADSAEPAATGTNAVYDEKSSGALSQHLQSTGAPAAAPDADAPGEVADVDRALAALPSGGGEISPLAAALPTGAASQLGMGESFTTQLTTGTLGYSVPLKLPTARGGVQPNLQLSYSAAGGFGLAGVGWTVGASAISRQTDRGTPRYDDRAGYHPEQDRFVFGGMELVPICTVTTGGTCAPKLAGEVMPAWSTGWQYFRARVEGAFLRFFWSPDHRTWRVQSKDGSNMELGVPLDGTQYEGGLERNPDAAAEIFRWHLTRQYDNQGQVHAAAGNVFPNNPIVFRYVRDANAVYLSDIFDTSPASAPLTTDLSRFAHHTSLHYEARADLASSYRAGWLTEYALRLARVDVTSKPFTGGASSPREIVRRYHLGYEPEAHRSLLSSVAMEGRCASTVVEDSAQVLPLTNCPRLPPLSFEYAHVDGDTEPLRDAQDQAFEPFDTTVRTLPGSPPHSLDEALTELTDVDADGLPDVLVTAAGLFRGGHGVYFNGRGGQGLPGFGPPRTMAVRPAADVVDADVLALDSPVVTALDLDADGIVNLVHMPRARRYSVFAPRKAATGGTDSYEWVGRAVDTASDQDLKIDFTSDAANTRVLDVNGDGLVDIVYSSATELQTFFALGRYPGGDDQFGQATWTGASSASIRNDPVRHCIPWSSTPVRFSSPDTRLADMNGDGLVDIVRVRSGQVQYWPGRGNGFWGTGERGDCQGEGFVESRHIEMHGAPAFGTTQPGTLLLDDVNADGMSDMIEVRNQGVDIYLNDNGLGFTARTILEDTPFRPSDSNYVRLTDIDGSGTPDILWGRAREYQYVDLTGGKTPHLLVKIKNGLGKTADLEYATSTDMMLAAAAAGTPWSSRAPLSTPVLRRATVRDNLERMSLPAGVYVTEYSYRDPVFEGRQREFRGFREATVKTIGDANSPTSSQRTVFLLGECPEGAVSGVSDVCATGQRWRDNWREPLKALPVVNEVFDENGVYLSTDHTMYTVRQLYTGLDGRRVTVPLPVMKDTFLYDTAAFDRAASTISMPELDLRFPDFGASESRTMPLRASAGTARVRTESRYDSFGNQTDAIRHGCVSGCPNGTDEAITLHGDFVLPAGDGSGWLWREQRAYVTGSVDTTRRNEQVRTFNSFGLLEESYSVLAGTLPLDRFHQSGGAIAPAPTAQSGGAGAAVQIMAADPSYDPYGQITFARGPNGRCVSTTFDPDYSQLPVTERVSVGAVSAANCGSRTLSHTVTYDRGLEAPLTSLDTRAQPSKFVYDGFGRVTELTYADPLVSGVLNSQPSARFIYWITHDGDGTPYSMVISMALSGPNTSDESFTDTYMLIDGLGRTIASIAPADPASGDPGTYLLSGSTTYDAKGAVARSYDPVFLPDLGGFTFEVLASSPYRSQEYDAFGQAVRAYGYDQSIEGLIARHALTTDLYDAADILPTSHQNTYLTTMSDGHGRGVQRIERIKVGAQVELRRTIVDYLPTGKPRRSIQRRSDGPDVVRFMRYDTLGRMVLNAEPNTSPNFNPDPNTPPDAIDAIRYAYNDAGDVVGVSDARGCGANYHYDAAGRLVAEDRSPCLASQAAYTAPNLTTGDGTETFNLYDTLDPDSANITSANPAFTFDANQLVGRLASHAALGAKTVFRYDALGRGVGVAVRIQKPGPSSAALASRYAPRWYVRTQTLDALDRIKTTTTGVTTPELLGSGGSSELRFSYGPRGTVTTVDSSYGTLLSARRLLADGRVQSLIFGDTAGTERYFSYDAKHRVQSVQTYRGNLPMWSSAPPGTSYTPPSGLDDPNVQLLLEDVQVGYDEVGNITSIEDHRLPSEWPASAKPASRTFEYDDLYRLTRSTYAYGGAADSWRSPYLAENQDPTRVQPSPHVSFTQRPTEQRWQYDSIGNIQQSTDDQQAFWDRSTGGRAHGTATTGPHRVLIASNRVLASSSPRKGDLSASYDPAGNLIGLIVRRDGPCLPATSSCWQRFDYQWDEVGQLSRARRWDLSTAERTSNSQLAQALPARAADADLSYGYAGQGSRTLKTALVGGVQKHTVYVFSTLELRGTSWDGTDYVQNAQTVSLRIHAGPVVARVIYGPPEMPSLSGNRQHLFLEIADHLGSGKALIDHRTSELVEYTTYQPYGAVETDYRPSRWRGFRELYKYSDKEEDIEVGLAFHGARYYSPYLSTWISPDPVTIHELGSDPNAYAYVHGTPLMAVDPDGRIYLAVAMLIAAIIAAVVAAVVSVAVQASVKGGFQYIDWRKVGMAAGVGFVAGAVSCGVGGVVAGAVAGTAGSIVGGLVGGAVGGAAGAAAGYGTGVAMGAYKFNGGEMGLAVAAGAVTGALGGGISGAMGAGWSSSMVSAVATSGAEYAFHGAVTGDWGYKTLLVSVGAGLAGAMANQGAQRMFGPRRESSPGMGPYSVPEDLPVKVVGGTPEQRDRTILAIRRVFSYEQGQEYLRAAQRYEATYGHKMHVVINDGRGNSFHPGGGVQGFWDGANDWVNIDPNDSHRANLAVKHETWLGTEIDVKRTFCLERTVAHEFGHAFTGIFDTPKAGDGMDSVIANDLPWTKQAGLEPRSGYNFEPKTVE